MGMRGTTQRRRPSPSTARRLARTIAAASAGLAAAAIATTASSSASDTPLLVVLLVPLTIYGGVGMLMASRHPANPLGWLFCAVGAVVGSSSMAAAYSNVGSTSGLGSGSLAGSDIAAWFLLLLPAAALAFVLPVFLLLYPTGRLLSPRWRPAVALAAVASSLWLVGTTARAGDGSGLPGMSDRRAALDGTLEIRSLVGEGTTLIGRMSLRAPAGVDP